MTKMAMPNYKFPSVYQSVTRGGDGHPTKHGGAFICVSSHSQWGAEMASLQGKPSRQMKQEFLPFLGQDSSLRSIPALGPVCLMSVWERHS